MCLDEKIGEFFSHDKYIYFTIWQKNVFSSLSYNINLEIDHKLNIYHLRIVENVLFFFDSKVFFYYIQDRKYLDMASYFSVKKLLNKTVTFCKFVLILCKFTTVRTMLRLVHSVVIKHNTYLYIILVANVHMFDYMLSLGFIEKIVFMKYPIYVSYQ